MSAVGSRTRFPVVSVQAGDRRRDDHPSIVKISMEKQKKLAGFLVCFDLIREINNKKQRMVRCKACYEVHEAPVVDGVKLDIETCRADYSEMFDIIYYILSPEQCKIKYPELFYDDKLPFWFPDFKACRCIGGGATLRVDAHKNKLYASLAKFAIDEYNKHENASLEYVRVDGAYFSIVSGLNQHVFIEARDAAAGGEKKLYRAKIYLNLTGQTQLSLFKPVERPSEQSCKVILQLACVCAFFTVRPSFLSSLFSSCAINFIS
ncbi:unnamed protein product [Dovyalis caffra]|uniref:Cysteine proteinase inhibitor n=1 Tax=Dovyalis caffra TaxID=77055 RepID=A0AAV1RXM2_9ROSI|nr:unnamed protein product [Dovyalis caffra]